MATTLSPTEIADRLDGGGRVLIRLLDRVLSAWAYERPDGDTERTDAVIVTGQLVFGGPSAPDVGDDITTWYVNLPVEVISPDELAEMELAAAADEAARPVYELGEQGQLVVAPDGSTILAAEDAPRLSSLSDELLRRANGFDPSDTPDDYPTLAYRRARGVVKGTEPAEDIIRRMREGAPAPFDQVASRRRTLARFARDYAKAWEDDEDPDLLGMLENNLQVSVRRVMEVTDP